MCTSININYYKYVICKNVNQLHERLENELLCYKRKTTSFPTCELDDENIQYNLHHFIILCYNIYKLLYLGGMVCTLKYDIIYRRNVQCRKSTSLPPSLIKVYIDIIGGRGGGVLFFVTHKPTAKLYHYYNTHYIQTYLYRTWDCRRLSI